MSQQVAEQRHTAAWAGRSTVRRPYVGRRRSTDWRSREFGWGLVRWAVWLWRTRNCPHPEGRRRPVGGDERLTGYQSRCLDCDKPLRQP